MKLGYVRSLAVLLGSPALSFLVLLFGCFDPWQLLGVMCGHNFPLSLLIFSVIGWFVLGVGAVLVASWREAPWRP